MVIMSLTEREFEILLWLVFSEDKICIGENMEEIDYEKLSTKFQRLANKFCFNDVIEKIKAMQGIEIDDKETDLKIKKNKISKDNDAFFCPKCNIYTNEKTYKTSCVICGTSLYRNIVNKIKDKEVNENG